jgi:CRISPR-associated protein Cas2
MRRLWVIAYDIADDRARRKVEKRLGGQGDRVQDSVFEAYLTSAQARGLLEELQKLMDCATDSLRFYPVCAWCVRDVTIIGQGRRSEDKDLIIL